MAKKTFSGVVVFSCLFLVACAGQSNSGKTSVANSNEGSGAESTVNGNEVAMSEAPMDESMFESSFDE